MPIETFNFIDSLNSSNPGSSDDVLQGDDHIRGIKSVLKNSFPNLAAAANATAAQFNQLVSGIFTFAAGSSGSPSILIGDAASAFYRVSTGIIGFVGRLSGNGAVDAGAMYYFPKSAPGGMASGGTATGTERYALCDGAVYNVSTFPALGAYLGSTYGGDGVSTFGMPNVANRFLRGAGGAIAVGATQANAIKSHSAGVSGTYDDHAHHYGAVSDGASLGGVTSFLTLTPTGAPAGALNVGSAVQVGSVTLNAGSISGDTGGVNGGLSNRNITGTASYSGDTETRPDAFAAYVCLKT
jgi:microcystin-dependent protein